MNLPVIILGCGGHSRVLVNALVLNNMRIIGFTAPKNDDEFLQNISYLGDDNAIFNYNPKNIKLVNGVGSVDIPVKRKKIYEDMRLKGYCFENVIHPSASVAPDVRLSDGVQIMAGAIVQPGTRIGSNSIINTGAVVDHDCDIGDHVHIAPRAVLSGNIRIEKVVHIGVGAIIVQGVSIEEESVVGAGAVILDDIAPCVTVAGVPGKIIKYHKHKKIGED